MADSFAAGSSAADPLILDDAVTASLVPTRDPRSYKGQAGKLLIVAGSLDHAGAALLAARAGGRAGAGLVHLAVPRSLQPLFAGRVLEATTIGLAETAAGAVDAAAAAEQLLAVEHDALLIGPGLPAGAATSDLVARLMVAPPVGGPDLAPVLVDAQALNALAARPDWWSASTRRAVMTPHTGEFARLLRSGEWPGRDEARDLIGDDAARAEQASAAARAWRQTVVLKGARTVIAASDGRVVVAPFENPALASGGTGDVLSGTIASLLAQHLDPFEAAALGVYLHGVAGDAIRDRLGDAGLLASDLPDEIARARKRLAAVRDRRASGRRVGFGPLSA